MKDIFQQSRILPNLEIEDIRVKQNHQHSDTVRKTPLGGCVFRPQNDPKEKCKKIEDTRKGIVAEKRPSLSKETKKFNVKTIQTQERYDS